MHSVTQIETNPEVCRSCSWFCCCSCCSGLLLLLLAVVLVVAVVPFVALLVVVMAVVPEVFVSVVMSVLTVVAGVAAVDTDNHSGGYSKCNLLNSMNACNNTHDSQTHEGDRERYLTLHAFFCVDLLSKLNLFVDYQ